jgi:hypothetical protein
LSPQGSRIRRSAWRAPDVYTKDTIDDSSGLVERAEG